MVKVDVLEKWRVCATKADIVSDAAEQGKCLSFNFQDCFLTFAGVNHPDHGCCSSREV